MLTATAESILASGSHQICVKDQGKNKKKAAEGSNCKKKAPLPSPRQAAITDNTFCISQGEVIYPSQGRPMMAVMLCGCTGYVMMSFQRRNQRLASVWGVSVVLVFLKLCLHFPFFFFLQNSPRDVSKPNLSPRAFPSPLLPSSRAGAGRWILTGKWVGHTVYCQPQRPLWPPRESPWRVSFSAPPPEMSEKNKTHCVTAVRHFLILFIL